jgi:hypothetical protein
MPVARKAGPLSFRYLASDLPTFNVGGQCERSCKRESSFDFETHRKNAVDQYTKKRPLHEELGWEIENILTEAIETRGLKSKINAIQSRAKEVPFESLRRREETFRPVPSSRCCGRIGARWGVDMEQFLVLRKSGDWFGED